jgi:hypothetical protein
VAENGRIQKVLLLMLSATAPGEIIAARDTLVRLLKEDGSDIHALVGHTNGLSEAEMKKLFDAGYDAGLQAAEQKQFGAEDFHNIDGTPEWGAVARFCQYRGDRLRANELEFVNDMAARAEWGREPTPKQEKWLRSIFKKLGGIL